MGVINEKDLTKQWKVPTPLPMPVALKLVREIKEMIIGFGTPDSHAYRRNLVSNQKESILKKIDEVMGML
jgi:hypothetical protein